MAAENSAHGDILDEILNNYDRSIDDILDGAEDRADDTGNSMPQGQAQIPEELGIDTEVKVQKARKPIPKLDEARQVISHQVSRLRSANGISKLQKIAKTGLKFRGKGHEFSDVALLLGTYQLWLDALYPRSKFADGLAMVEKLGHQKNVQRLRSEWINESKPKTEQEDESSEDNISVAANPGITRDISPQQVNLSSQAVETHSQSAPFAHPGDGAPLTVGTTDPVRTMPVSGTPDDDELDQLLAEEHELSLFGSEARNSSTSAAVVGSNKSEAFNDDIFPEEEEMMREMEFFG